MDGTQTCNGPCPSFAAAMAAAYNPKDGLIYFNTDFGTSSGIYTYNPTTNTYTQATTSSSDNGQSYESGTIDPVNQKFVITGAGAIRTYAIGGGGNFTSATPSSCSAILNSPPGAAWDAVQQKIIFMPSQGGNTVYLYDTTAGTCTTQTLSGGPPSASPSTVSMWGRFGYDPAYGVFVASVDYNQDFFTLRLTPASGGGSGGLSISNVSATNITTNSAVIAWITSAPASSQIEYGTTANYGSMTTLDPTLLTSHSQTIAGLSPSTLYHFRVHSTDANNSAVSGDLTFATNSTDNTPPSVTMTAPATNSTVSGSVTVSANASDNVGVASVQFLLDGTNLGTAVTSSPYSISWDTTLSANGSHSLSALAKDAAGNATTATAVAVTVSNGTSGGSNANADYLARCQAPGVIRCVDFDNASELLGNSGQGSSSPKLDTNGDALPTIDTTTFASGTGSLLLTVPASAPNANTSGSFNIDFTDDLSQQFDSLINGDPASLINACGGSPCGNEFWIQWRQRFDQNMLQHFAGSQGWKQIIVGEGDTPATTAYSCTDIHLVVQNSGQLGIPQMYHSCGVKLSQYDVLQSPTGVTDSMGSFYFSPQDAAGGYEQCRFSSNFNLTIPPCVGYVADEWMTFQLHVKVGTWYPGFLNSSGRPPGVFLHDSTIQLYVAREGQPSQLVIDYHPTGPSCDANQSDIPICEAGYDLANPTAFGQLPASGTGNPHVKYGKVWLLNYQTNKCNSGCPNEPAAHTWYDELIISKQQIADPKF